MLKDLIKDQLLLAELMSQISEAAFSAGWMQNLEFDLWRIINGGSKNYGHHILTPEEIDQLQSLSNKCGCWIIFDEENEETAVDLKTWKETYSIRKNL